MPELVCLGDQRRHEVRILVTERIHRDASPEIQVIAAFGIPHAGALAVVEHDIARTIHG